MKILGVWVSSNNSHAWYHTGPVKTGCSFKIWGRPCMTSDNLCLHPYRVRHLIYSEVKYPKIFAIFRLRSTNFFFRHSIVPNEYCYDQKFWTQLQCSYSNMVGIWKLVLLLNNLLKFKINSVQTVSTWWYLQNAHQPMLDKLQKNNF